MTKLNVISAASKAQTQMVLTTAARITPMTDITELTSVQKNANIHRLSRLIAYAPNDELRQLAVEVEQYTDQLIEALEKAQRANAAQDDHINQQQDRIDTLEKRNAELGREVIHLQSLKTVNAARQEAQSEFHRGYSCGHKDALLESRTVTAENLQESAYRAGLTSGWNLGLANNNDGFNKCLAAHAAGIKVEDE